MTGEVRIEDSLYYPTGEVERQSLSRRECEDMIKELRYYAALLEFARRLASLRGYDVVVKIGDLEPNRVDIKVEGREVRLAIDNGLSPIPTYGKVAAIDRLIRLAKDYVGRLRKYCRGVNIN